MDDEIKDMFFAFFLVKTIKIAKKEDYTDFSVYLQCEGAVNLQRPSLAQLPASSLGFLL